MLISHFWDRQVPIFSDVRFSYLALVQDKKNHVRFTGKCMLYSLCQLPVLDSISFFRSYTVYIVIMALNIHITVISHVFCNGSFRIFSLSKTTIFNEDENLPVATNTRHSYIYWDHKRDYWQASGSELMSVLLGLWSELKQPYKLTPC